jgi:hypothetical protein
LNNPAHPTLLGGVQVDVSSARSTEFTKFGWDSKEGVVRGQVWVMSPSGPAPGSVLLTFHGPDETADNTAVVPLDSTGTFVFTDGLEWVRKFRSREISGHYPGRPGYGPADAERPSRCRSATARVASSGQRPSLHASKTLRDRLG